MVAELACSGQADGDHPDGRVPCAGCDRIGTGATDGHADGYQPDGQARTITAFLKPLYEGGIDTLPPGSHCIANAYTSNYEALHSGPPARSMRFGLHAIDAVGLVHAMILRLQAVLMPVTMLVLKALIR